MAGAAQTLGLAQMIMATRLPVRLRLLIPAVENSIAGNAFRTSDVLVARNGLTSEIVSTDAEGRLILADALVAGAITAALYLDQFVTRGVPWVHVDFMGFNAAASAGRPEGGEAMGLRALYGLIKERFGRRQ